MQAITTTYKGPTDHNGSRVIAKCDAGRVVVGWDHALNVIDNHKAAARALIDKLGWNAAERKARKWVSGSTASGLMVHVCAYESETWEV